MPIILRVPRTAGVDLVVIIDDEGIERMRAHDPFEVELAAVSAGARVSHVSFVHANEAEIAEIVQLARAKGPKAAAAYATRGWKFKPERGDGMSPTSISRKGPPT